ncbi:hypothetical protein ACS5PU_02395 [Pedobacter sp. GSP4]|uniref:hypothetical protein n=1 Tax=Pedobacter sp. GSP4 TaxID=3453716 RepID=UPI003EE95B69
MLKKKKLMGILTEKPVSIGAKALVIGAIAGLALATVYTAYKRKNKPGQASEPGDHHLTDLIMERYVFNIATGSGQIPAVVEAAGDCYSVHLDGKYAGTMWQDERKGMQWNTEDHDLDQYMWEIAVHLSEAFSRKGFPSLLMGTYPEITSTAWKTDETLEVNLRQETDMDVFNTFLKDEILNLVTFEEHLDLMVKKENDPYFIIVGIN